MNDIWWDGEVILDSYIRDYSESSEKQLVNDGVYYYVLDVFNQAQNQKEYYTGHITILNCSPLLLCIVIIFTALSATSLLG